MKTNDSLKRPEQNKHFAPGRRGVFGKAVFVLGAICIAILIALLPHLNDEPDIQPATGTASVTAKENIGEKYPEIAPLFAEIFPSSEVSVRERSSYLDVAIVCSDISSDQEPENWITSLSALSTALADGKAVAESYGFAELSAQVESNDGTILASGYGGQVRFDGFMDHTYVEDEKENPPTISKFEYDQIAVGMTYTQVVEIIGGEGVLQTEIGGGDEIIHLQNYIWEGEGAFPGTASLLFDGYILYSKHEVGLV